MIIVRLLSPGPFGWLAPPKFTRVQGADIVMESITPTSGRECKRLTSAPCVGRLHWPGTHESRSTGDQHFDFDPTPPRFGPRPATNLLRHSVQLPVQVCVPHDGLHV